MTPTLPARPIPRYPDLKCPEDWGHFLTLGRALLQHLAVTQEPPESDEVFQAVAHLVQTLITGYQRRLH